MMRHGLLTLLELQKILRLKQLGYDYVVSDNSSCLSDDEAASGLNSLESIKKELQECYLCELSKTRRCVILPSGDNGVRLMCVGGAPESDDENSGKSFAGAAGELLEKMLVSVLNLQRQEVYITNVLKCRPPQDRKPKRYEIETCLPFLENEIAACKPKIIVTLGETALRALHDFDASLQELHGTMIEKKAYKLFPIYHPSYVLRNPSLKKILYHDLLLLKKAIT